MFGDIEFVPAHKALCQFPLITDMLITLWDPSASSELQSIEASAQAHEGTTHDYGQSAAVSSTTQRLTDATPPAASAQAKFNLVPSAVEKWGTFNEEMKIEEIMDGQEELLNGVIANNVFRSFKTERHANTPNEKFCASIMDRMFTGPFLDDVVHTNVEFARYGLEFFVEDAHSGFRTDWTIAREAKPDDPNDKVDVHCGMPATGPSTRYAIIVHEHKACAKFPNSVKRADVVEEAEEIASQENVNVQEVLQPTVLHHMHDDLTDYWYHFTRDNNYKDAEIRDFRSPIVQVYVYMLRMCVRYGVLSTTDRTWFLRLEPDNTLLVSQVFEGIGTGEKSVKLAYAAFIVNALKNAKLELNDEERERIFTSVPFVDGILLKDMTQWKGSYNMLVGKSTGGSGGLVSSLVKAAKRITGRGNKGATKNMNTTTSSSDDDESLIKKLKALQDSLPCTVEQFPYRGGLEGVIKQYPMGQYSISAHTVLFGVDYVAKVMTPKNDSRQYQMDAIASFENEMAVYEELRPLMGIHIPFYLFGGRHMFNDLLIAVSYEGDALSQLPKASITSEIKHKARAALSAVHEYGVAHNDIRLNNFVVDHIGAVRVIDFGMATVGASDKLIAGDNAAFDKLFAFVE